MKKSVFIALLFVSLFMSPIVSAGSRDFLFHQGIATDTAGNPLEGNINVTFRLYEEAVGGTPLWEETQLINFVGGVYLTELGSDEPFPLDLFDRESLFLGIQIEGDSEMTPRFEIRSVPFAQQAEVAVTARSLADDIVTSAAIAPGAIESSDIAPGAISPTELASTGVAPGTYTLATVTVDADGRIVSAASGIVPGGDITGVAAGAGLTGGGTAGDVTLEIGAGTGITVGADTVAVDQSFSPVWTGTHTFNGGMTLGTALTLQNAESLDTSTDAVFRFARNNAGAVTLTARDDDANADLVLQPGGTGSLNLDGPVQIGTGGAGSATPDLLKLDVKSNPGDPSGVDGAVYYSADQAKFRCFQDGGWRDCIAAPQINIAFFDSSSSSGTTNSTSDCVTFTDTGTSAGRLGQSRIVTMDGFSTIRLIARAARGAGGGQGQPTIQIQDVTSGGGTTLVSISSGWTPSCATQTATASISQTGQRQLECQEFGANATDDPSYSHCAIELIP